MADGDLINCPNCESRMNAGDSCPECEHDDDPTTYCCCDACRLRDDEE